MTRARYAVAVVALLLLAPVVSAFPLTWSFREFQPNLPQGGRANTIAVKPGDPSVMIVASETGGLFRTFNEGVTWRHIDSLMPFAMGAVTYVPSDPNIIITTANEGFLNANAGGIWRSTDGGSTWTQAPHPPPPAGLGTTRFSASEISIAPDTQRIFVATSYGVSISADNGATWTTSQPLLSSGVSSVLALAGNVVLTGARWTGIRRSTDGGATWTSATSAPAGVTDLHAFARSPFDAAHAYVVDQNTGLFVTEDAGITWRPIGTAPTGGGSCGGIGFIKAIRTGTITATSLRLFFGNRCFLYRLAPARISGTTRFDYSGSWISLALDHADTRDLAFKRTKTFVRPLLLGTDGGLHRTADGGTTWTLAGGGVNGYNALQITEVKGQWIDDIRRYDLYFGTQDNNNLSSIDVGVTWPNSLCCEGFFFEMQKRVATAADAQITHVACGDCANYRSGAAFAMNTGWTNPAGAVVANPSIVSKSFHVQGVDADAGFASGLVVTLDLGTTWSQYAAYPEQRADLPKLTHRRVLKINQPVLYQSIRTGFNVPLDLQINQLVRLTKRRASSTASVYYPAMNGFGGLGINPTMFAWYQVFGVDPKDSRHIIAPDIINEKMMRSTDGGDNWSDIPALTTLVTDSGRFGFRNSVFPHASAVSFYPRDPNHVAVGTHENGVMLSSDHGATWTKIPDSERATYITSIEWRSATDLFVSTYGRGLWRLQGTLWIPEFERLCRVVDCRIRWIDRGDPPPDIIDPGIIIFEGRALGVRVERGRVVEVFVSPGSSVGFVAKPQRAPKIKITESRLIVGLVGDARGLTSWPLSEGSVVALALDQSQRLRGFAFARTELPASEAAAPAQDVVGDEPEQSQRSPTAGKPYVYLAAPGRGIERLTAGGQITVTGRGFPAGSTVEVLVDGEAAQKAAVRDDGAFVVTVTAPQVLGRHTLTVRDAATRRVIDGTQFNVIRGGADKGGDRPAGRPVLIKPPVRGR